MEKEIIESAYPSKENKSLILELKNRNIKFTTSQHMKEIRNFRYKELKDCEILFSGVNDQVYGYVPIIVYTIKNNQTGEILYSKVKSEAAFRKNSKQIIKEIVELEAIVKKLKKKILKKIETS